MSSIASAGPNYTYIDLGFVTANSEGNEDTGGFVLRGSYGEDLFHAGAEIAVGELEGGKGKGNRNGQDTSGYRFYFGMNPAVTDNIDLIVRVGYRADDFKGDCQVSSCYIDELSGFFTYSDDREITSGNYKIEQEAVFLELGTRALITEKFELNSYVTYSNGNTKIDQPLIDLVRLVKTALHNGPIVWAVSITLPRCFLPVLVCVLVKNRDRQSEFDIKEAAEGNIYARLNF